MSFLLGKACSSCLKSFISDKIFTPIAGVSFINHYGKFKRNPNEIPHRKILQPVQIHQHRHFSMNFGDSLYETATTGEATKFVLDLLIGTHDLLGLHWWETLVATPLLYKLCYGLPCAIYQHKLIAKTELISLKSKPLIINLKNEILIEGKQKRWPPAKVERHLKQEARKLMKNIIIENNIHPFKIAILSLVQLPPLLLLTLSISKFSKDVSSGAADSMTAALQFRVGGPFWCPDLSLLDPTFILPTTLLVFSFAGFEISRLLRPQKEQRVFKILNHLFRLFPVMLFFVALKVSSGLALFWTSNAILGFIQTLLLFLPRVRRFLRIPKTPSELEKPYSHLIEEVKNKWKLLRSKK